MEAERRKREYNSLFASNLSLSLRNGPGSVNVEEGRPASPIRKNSSVAWLTPTTDRAAGPSRTDKAVSSADDDAALRQADGKNYRLFEGTVIETVLTNRLNGSFSGPSTRW